MNHGNRCVLAGLLLSGLLAAATPSHADPAGMDLIRKMVARYRGLRTYSDAWTITEQQGKQRRTMVGSTRLARPNRFFFSTEMNGRLESVFAGDGKTSTLYTALRRQYAQEPASAGLPLLLRGVNHAAVRLFAGVDFSSSIRDARIVGRSAVDGAPVHVVKVTFKIPAPPKGVKLSEAQKADLERLRTEPPDIRYYIGVADTLMHRNEMIVHGKTAGGESATMTVRQEFRNIHANQAIPAAAFAFTPPRGSTKFTPPKQK